MAKMTLSNRYDLAIKKSIKAPTKNYESEEGVYFNNEYRNRLIEDLKANGFYEDFKHEIEKFYDPENHKKCKMCSCASSSKLCYIYLKTPQKSTIFEKIIDNGNICKPHLDAFEKQTNTYYECKCHEITNTHSLILPAAYESLLKDIFNVTNLSKNEDGDFILNYESFGITGLNRPCGKYFDFKQFICHIIGLITLPKSDQKPTLQYVFFEPDEKYIFESEYLETWYKEFIEIEVDLFIKLSEMPVYIDGKKMELQEAVNLPMPKIVQVSTMKDPFIER